MGICDIYSQLSRCSTASGSSTGLSLVGPTMVKASKTFLFTEGSLKVENKEHLVDFVVTLYFTNTVIICIGQSLGLGSKNANFQLIYHNFCIQILQINV